MSTQAIDSLTTALKRTKRMLATFELYDRTIGLATIGQTDERLTQLVSVETHAAAEGIQESMDHFEGEILTQLDTALDEVVKTHAAYKAKTSGSAPTAFVHAQAAYAAIYAAYVLAGREAGDIAS